MSIFRRTGWLTLLLGSLFSAHAGAQSGAEIRAQLEAKANEYVANLQTHHLRDQQVVSLHGGGIDEQGDAATYTSYYVAAEALRYRATGDAQAFLHLTRGLDALHAVQVASGEPGIVSRFVQNGTPWTGSRTFTSKDVYTAVLFAYSVAYPALPEGPLKDRVRSDVAAIGDRFLADGFAFVSSRHGLFLDLHPRLSRSELAYLVEKDPAAVRQAVASLRRFGQDYETFGTLLAGRTTSYLSDLLARWESPEATGGAGTPGAWCERFANGFVRDSSRCHYRTAFTKEEIRSVRDFFATLDGALGPLRLAADDLDTPEEAELHDFLSELFAAVDAGQDPAPVFDRHWERGFTHLVNRLLALVRGLPPRLPAAAKFITDLFGSTDRPDYFFYWLDKKAAQGELDAGNAALIRKLFSNLPAAAAALDRYVSVLPARIQTPEELPSAPANALLLLHVLKVASQITGEPRFAQAYDQQREAMLPLARRLSAAVDHVLTTAFGDAAADAQRAQGTHQLKWLALYDLLTLEQDPGVRSVYREILEREFAPIRDELNAFATFIHTIRSGRLDVVAYAQAVQSLFRFPRYGPADFEHSCADAYVQDGLGGCIQFLGGEVLSRRPIPLDRRPRDASTWQRSPRRLSNRNPGHTFAGVDYLLAYWLGRAHGLLDALPDGILQIGSAPERLPLLRFYHPRSGDHFYTIAEAHANEALRVGYVPEGHEGYVQVAASAGAVPLYRLFHPGFGDHFYTTDPAERDRAMGFGYLSEGHEGYVASAQVPGTTPLYRLYHPGIGDHFYTTGAAERDRALGLGYVGEATPGFVWLQRESAIGLDVQVRPVDPGTGRAPVALTFAEVVAEGETRLAVGSSGPPAPAGFDLGSPPRYYEVSTDAGFVGPVEICIDYGGVVYANEWSLRLLHFEHGLWRDVTSSRDPGRHRLCGITGSFSPFVVARDAVPPVTTAALSQPPNAAGWHREAPVLTFDARDNGGDGGLEIVHSATGAQAAAVERAIGPTLSLPIAAEGETVVTFFAEDNSGNAEPPRSVLVRLDPTPPGIAAARHPLPNAAGWNRSDVTVSFHCQDGLSGVASCSPDVLLTLEGAGQSAAGLAEDRAGNRSAVEVTGIHIDKTPPAVAYSGNAGDYTVDLRVEIRCTASDSLSGLAEVTCEDILGPAYAFGLGSHTFNAAATDVAGNKASAEARFEVRVTFDSLCNLTRRFVAKPGVAHALCSKLDAAEEAAARGNDNAKRGQLAAYSHQVRAQAGDSLGGEEAAVLVSLAGAL